jgi:hypothetical protein
LSKLLTPVLTGLGLGSAVAFALTFLYAPGSTTPMLYGAGAGLIGAYLAANLSGNRRQAAADPLEKFEALESEPPTGRARLFLYREGFVARLAGLNVSVDGQVVTQLKSPQFACITLAPGRHVLAAAFGGLAGPQNRAAQLIIEAEPNADAAVLMAVKLGVARNAVEMRWQADVDGVKRTLAGMDMRRAEVAEV